MNTVTHTAITRNVRIYLAITGMTQTQLAHHLGISQSNVSARLRAATDWSASDLEALRSLGISFDLPALADPPEGMPEVLPTFAGGAA